MEIFFSLFSLSFLFGIFISAIVWVIGYLVTSSSAIAASAEDGSSSVTSVITNAGSQLTSEFTNLASTVAPILIGIGVVGLGIYAVVYLFKMAKKFFGKAAG